MVLWCFMTMSWCQDLHTLSKENSAILSFFKARSFFLPSVHGLFPSSFVYSSLSAPITVPHHHNESFVQSSGFSLWESLPCLWGPCSFFDDRRELSCSLLGWLPTHDQPLECWDYHAGVPLCSASFLPSTPFTSHPTSDMYMCRYV